MPDAFDQAFADLAPGQYGGARPPPRPKMPDAFSTAFGPEQPQRPFSFTGFQGQGPISQRAEKTISDLESQAEFRKLPPSEQYRFRQGISDQLSSMPEFRSLPPEEQQRLRQRALFKPEPERRYEPPTIPQRSMEVVQAGLEELGRAALGAFQSLDPTQAGSALEAGIAPPMAGMLGTPPAIAGILAGEMARETAGQMGASPNVQAGIGLAANLLAGARQAIPPSVRGIRAREGIVRPRPTARERGPGPTEMGAEARPPEPPIDLTSEMQQRALPSPAQASAQVFQEGRPIRRAPAMTPEEQARQTFLYRQQLAQQAEPVGREFRMTPEEALTQEIMRRGVQHLERPVTPRAPETPLAPLRTSSELRSYNKRQAEHTEGLLQELIQMEESGRWAPPRPTTVIPPPPGEAAQISALARGRAAYEPPGGPPSGGGGGPPAPPSVAPAAPVAAPQPVAPAGRFGQFKNEREFAAFVRKSTEGKKFTDLSESQQTLIKNLANQTEAPLVQKAAQQVLDRIPKPRARMEDSEVALSTFIRRRGGINIPKDMREEFGFYNRPLKSGGLYDPKGLSPGEMAIEARDAGVIQFEEGAPETNALLENLRGGRGSSRVSQQSQAFNQMLSDIGHETNKETLTTFAFSEKPSRGMSQADWLETKAAAGERLKALLRQEAEAAKPGRLKRAPKLGEAVARPPEPPEGVPAFVSRQRKQELADLGYKREEIAKMSPAEADSVVRAQETAPLKPPVVLGPGEKAQIEEAIPGFKQRQPPGVEKAKVAPKAGPPITEQAQAVADFWRSKQGAYAQSRGGIEEGGVTGKAIGGTYKEINERRAAQNTRKFDALIKTTKIRELTDAENTEIQKAYKNLPKEKKIAPPEPPAAPRFEHVRTKEGIVQQGVMPGMEEHKVATGGIKPRVEQKTGLTPLEIGTLEDPGQMSITDLIKKSTTEKGAVGGLTPEEQAAESYARRARAELYRRVRDLAAKTGESIQSAAGKLGFQIKWIRGEPHPDPGAIPPTAPGGGGTGVIIPNISRGNPRWEGPPQRRPAFATDMGSADTNKLPVEYRDIAFNQVPVPTQYSSPLGWAREIAGAKATMKVPGIVGFSHAEIMKDIPAGRQIVFEMDTGSDLIRSLQSYLEPKALKIYEGLNDASIKKVDKLLDLEGARQVAEDMGILARSNARRYPLDQKIVNAIRAQFNRLTPEERAAYPNARLFLDDLGRLPKDEYDPSQTFSDYFHRNREVLSMEHTLRIRVGDGEITKTVADVIPKKTLASFERRRTSNAAADDLGLDAVLGLVRAITRNVAINGGFDPRTGAPIAGFLERIQPALEAMPKDLPIQSYTKLMLEHYLGHGPIPTPSNLARVIIATQFTRTMGASLTSPIMNHTQKANLLAIIGFKPFRQGYMDMWTSPERLELAKTLGVDFDIGALQSELRKIGIEKGHVGEHLQDFVNFMGTLFRMSEKSNQVHSFLAALRRGEEIFGPSPEAIEYARRVQSATQFGRQSSEILAYQPMQGPGSVFADWPVVMGQFKRFAMNQIQFQKNLFSDAVRRAGVSERYEPPRRIQPPEPPIELRAQGQPPVWQMPPERIPWPKAYGRSLRYLMALTALGGADTILPGLDDQIRKKVWEGWPGGLAGLFGVYLADRVGLLDEPGDLARTIFFWMPGATIANVTDAWSAYEGYDYSPETGSKMGQRKLTEAERTYKAIRAFPIGGVAWARLARAISQYRSGELFGEEQPLTPTNWQEAIGLATPSGPRREPFVPGEKSAGAIGFQSTQAKKLRESLKTSHEIQKERDQVVHDAASEYVSGELTDDILRQDNAQLMIEDFNEKHPGSEVKLSHEALEAARRDRKLTMRERQARSRPRDIRQAEEILDILPESFGGPPAPP